MCRTLFFFISLFFSILLSCNFNIIYKCLCAERGVVGHACRCMSEWVSVCVCVCVCEHVRAFLAVIELLFGSVLKVGFYIMKWNVIYKCVRACVRACVHACVCWIFILPILVLDIGLYFTSEHYSYLWCVCVCVCVCARMCMCVCMRAHAGVSMCIWVLFW